jgi:type II secretory pathway pseudopilin PulG
MSVECDRPRARRAHHRRKQASGGFSILESLIALAIAAAVLNAYFDTIAVALSLDRRSRAHAEAGILAAALMDQVGTDIAVEAQSQEGATDRGGRWRITISPGAALDVAPGTAPYAVAGLATVVVNIEGPELPNGYRLVSLRLINGTLK